ncbi:hypothetical protein DFH07DRAFT_764398 [Mycena maculata]|uniref:Uncharacterized protein n=1 Tax=Mycena maculata TaxID=230809 RepID=A0AAD7KB56_9AGAR|nr:hypothetical protein DFH07DRAFT_764398 [Mycena maculata]
MFKSISSREGCLRLGRSTVPFRPDVHRPRWGSDFPPRVSSIQTISTEIDVSGSKKLLSGDCYFLRTGEVPSSHLGVLPQSRYPFYVNGRIHHLNPKLKPERPTWRGMLTCRPSVLGAFSNYDSFVNKAVEDFRPCAHLLQVLSHLLRITPLRTLAYICSGTYEDTRWHLRSVKLRRCWDLYLTFNVKPGFRPHNHEDIGLLVGMRTLGSTRNAPAFMEGFVAFLSSLRSDRARTITDVYEVVDLQAGARSIRDGVLN